MGPAQTKPQLFASPWVIPLLAFALVLATFATAQGQSKTTISDDYVYVSPVPGSEYNSPANSILVRHRDLVDASLISRDAIQVVGSQSGPHTGRLELLDDSRTVRFTPTTPFSLGERVRVDYGMDTASVYISPMAFDFTVTSVDPASLPDLTVEDWFPGVDWTESSAGIAAESALENPCGVPGNYPDLSVSYSNDPEAGYIFMTPLRFPAITLGPLLILDNLGNPIFYRQLLGGASDFGRQADGRLTYFDVRRGRYFAIDSNYELVDGFGTNLGYGTDPHDIVVLPNNHALLMSYDRQRVRMDLIVPGGNPNALVTGLIIQEIDENKNAVFQWRSWDHFEITDAEVSGAVNLTAPRIDYVHGNALTVDHDGNILVSCRHMNEITKISRETGEIIWRMGPHAKNNQFVFPNDSRGFSHQHHVRVLHNGQLSIYDNGVFLSPQYSRGVTYNVVANKTNKRAPMVWEYRHPTDIFGRITGNVQHRKDGGTMICWGGLTNSDTKITDLHPDGTIALEIDLPGPQWTYRARRYPWRTTLFTTDVETLDFGMLSPGSEAFRQVTVRNNSDRVLDFTCIETTDPAFTVEAELPRSLQPGESMALDVRFAPQSEGDHPAKLYVKTTGENEMIAQDVFLNGSAVANEATSEAYEVSGAAPGRFALYAGNPNPFTTSTTIRFDLPVASHVSLEIYDLRGRRVDTIVDGDLPPGRHARIWRSGAGQSGLYFARMVTGEFTATRKLIVMD